MAALKTLRKELENYILGKGTLFFLFKKEQNLHVRFQSFQSGSSTMSFGIRDLFKMYEMFKKQFGLQHAISLCFYIMRLYYFYEN